MTRCPKTARPSQFRGRARYRFAGVTFQCVLEAGHAGPCGMEPLPEVRPAYTAPFDVKVTFLPTESKPQTPEQIAAGDARYREHMRRKHAR